MPNIGKQPDFGGVPLDKLAQLPTDGVVSLRKRARSKWYTRLIIGGLCYLDSPLHKYYEIAYHCCDIITQVKSKFTSKYCNTRVCHVCNRIRTGKLINGYLKQVLAFPKVYMVTLTIPNCKGRDLHSNISMMTSRITNIIRVIRERRKIPISGIRKIEVTYNAKNDTYHPHFHLLVDMVPHEIVSLWLKYFPKASKLAQDVREADQNSLKELFKYSTKIIVGDLKKNKGLQVYLCAIDVIMIALKGKRTFQPFGSVKKVTEDVEELDSQEYEDLQSYDFVEWFWNDKDWYSPVLDNFLTGYIPPDIEIELIS